MPSSVDVVTRVTAAPPPLASPVLAEALALSPVASLLLDAATLELLTGNAGATALLGCDPAALAAAWRHALAAGPDLRARLGLVTATALPEDFDALLILPGRQAQPMQLRARRVSAAGQDLLSVALVDVSRRRRAEAGLASVRRRLDVALSGADLGAWHWDATTERLTVSSRWAAMLGLPAEPGSLARADLLALIHPDDLARVRAAIAAHDAGGVARYEVEFRMRHSDGRWRSILSRGEAIEHDATGRPLVVSGTHLDVTAQREAAAARLASEAAARQSLSELETLYRSAPLGLGQVDRDFRFVRINQALAEMNGTPAEAHLGRPIWDLVPDLRAAAEPLMRRVMERGETITGIEFTGETPKAPGVKRDWVEQFYPLRDPATQAVVGMGVVCEEVTARKHAERTRTLLLRELDHRVKNLFAILSSLVTFSAREAPSPQVMRQVLLGRIGALARAHDLVRPAMAGDGGIDLPGTSLADLLLALLEPFQGPAGSVQRLRLSGPRLPLGGAAAPPLALALHEMATNAGKYGALSRAGGLVDIEWSTDATRLRLRWRETGGPAVVPPAMRGFGHRLVTQSAVQLGGTARFDWQLPGLVVELTLPLERLAG